MATTTTENKVHTKRGNNPTFDTRVALRGEKGTAIKKALDEKMEAESYPTYQSAIIAALTEHFGITATSKTKPRNK